MDHSIVRYPLSISTPKEIARYDREDQEMRDRIASKSIGAFFRRTFTGREKRDKRMLEIYDKEREKYERRLTLPYSWMDPAGGPPPSKMEMEMKKEKKKRLKQSLNRIWPLSSEEELLVLTYRQMIKRGLTDIEKVSITHDGIVKME